MEMWHLSCVRRYLRQARETYRDEVCADVRALYRRLRELRVFVGMGGSADVPEVVLSDEE